MALTRRPRRRIAGRVCPMYVLAFSPRLCDVLGRVEERRVSLCQATVLTQFICLFCAVPRIRTVRSVFNSDADLRHSLCPRLSRRGPGWICTPHSTHSAVDPRVRGFHTSMSPHRSCGARSPDELSSARPRSLLYPTLIGYVPFLDMHL